MRFGDLLELRIAVRAADSALLQFMTGFWPSLLVAFALRLYGILHFPFIDQEDYAVRVPVDALFGFGPQSGQAPFWTDFFFRTPLNNSQAITPLLWWLLYALRLAVKDPNLGVRFPPFLFGLMGLALFYRLARRFFRPPLPVLLAWLLAFHDIYFWIGTKSQFIEPLLVCFALAVLLALFNRKGGWKPLIAGSAWAVVALGFHFVKGLMLLAPILLVLGVRWLTSAVRQRRLALGWLGKRVVVVGLIASPLIVYLVAAEAYIKSVYQVRFGGDYVQGIGQMIFLLTLGYGQGRRAALVGPPKYGLAIYSQGDAWPVSTFLFPIILAGSGLAVFTLIKWARDGWPLEPGGAYSRTELGLYILLAIIPVLASLVAKGSVGEHYHIPYLPAAWMAVGLVLERLWAGRRGAWGLVIGVSGIYVGVGLSWVEWVRGDWQPGWPFVVTAAAGVAGCLVYGLSRSLAARRAMVVGLAVFAAVLFLARGPLYWANFAPFGPEPGSWVLEQIQRQYHPLPPE